MRVQGAFLATLLVSAIVLVASASASAAWSPAGSQSLARSGAVAVPLADGKVLVVGGSTNAGNGYDTRTVDIYDPATNSWSTTGSLAHGRTEHVATALADGRVLVTGGENANICTNDATTEIYDPSSGTWSFSGDIGLPRAGAVATLLTNGEVLLAGGGNRCGSVYSSAELYDPVTGTWSSTGSMITPRQHANAVLLSDGRVLVVGGAGVNPFAALSSAEIYDPATGLWSATGSMATTRHSVSLVLLADGRVMAAGGYSGAAFGGGYYGNGPSVEIWDPATGLWSATADMSVARSGGSLSLLADHKVLAAGGYDDSTDTYASTAESWDPVTGTWTPTISMANARSSHTATVLANGRVLVAGGGAAAAEIYRPTPPTTYDKVTTGTWGRGVAVVDPTVPANDTTPSNFAVVDLKITLRDAYGGTGLTWDNGPGNGIGGCGAPACLPAVMRPGVYKFPYVAGVGGQVAEAGVGHFTLYWHDAGGWRHSLRLPIQSDPGFVQLPPWASGIPTDSVKTGWWGKGVAVVDPTVTPDGSTPTNYAAVYLKITLRNAYGGTGLNWDNGPENVIVGCSAPVCVPTVMTPGIYKFPYSPPTGAQVAEAGIGHFILRWHDASGWPHRLVLPVQSDVGFANLPLWAMP